MIGIFQIANNFQETRIHKCIEVLTLEPPNSNAACQVMVAYVRDFHFHKPSYPQPVYELNKHHPRSLGLYSQSSLFAVTILPTCWLLYPGRRHLTFSLHELCTAHTQQRTGCLRFQSKMYALNSACKHDNTFYGSEMRRVADVCILTLIDRCILCGTACF